MVCQIISADFLFSTYYREIVKVSIYSTKYSENHVLDDEGLFSGDKEWNQVFQVGREL